MEFVPVILGEFLEELKTGSRIPSESIWKTDDVEIHLTQGTPLSPPKNKANIVILEMTLEDEVSV